MSDERPWKLQLVCCGRDDGVVTCETRADAELTRSAYISAEGHDRQAILTGPPGAVETDPVALLGEYLGALGKGDWSETVCADMRALLEQARAERNAATARAEQAEAALARLRAQLGESGIEWGVQHPLYGTDYIEGADNARMKCDQLNADEADRPWRVVTRLSGQWRGEDEPDATRLERYDDAPRVALERAEKAEVRAEKAGAALAEMRERLGEPVVQWAVMLDDVESSPLPEKVARRMASDPFRTTLLTRDTYPNTAWRLADATPPTALERAADEQGDGGN